MFSLSLLLASVNFSDPSNVLRNYVQKPQPDYGWRETRRWITGDGIHLEEFSMVSQKWQDHRWNHDLVLASLPRANPSPYALLVVTGDRVDRRDLPFAEKLLRASGIPVATVFGVPNQPLFDLREDDLIAYTFGRYFETGDDDWPLLLPMTNSVIKAMDAITQATKGAIKKFFITGESKRGWTTWLAAATGDPRICGIAPVAFDNLDFGAQLNHQMSTWGHLSEMLGSYSGPGLTEEAHSPAGKRLLEIVDPYSYLTQIRIPVMVIRGANDPYWTVDASSLYWDRIDSPKRLIILPNEGHDFQSDKEYIKALADLTKFSLESRSQCSATFDALNCHFRWKKPVARIEIWQAESDTKDFRSSKWKQVGVITPKTERSLEVPLPPIDSHFAAFFAQFVARNGAIQSSLVQILSGSRSQQR